MNFNLVISTGISSCQMKIHNFTPKIYQLFQNINCLSKAVRIEPSNVDGSNNKIFIATNTLLYKLLNYSFNSFLIFLSLFYFPRLKQKF